jgi:predicted RecB family nuclease
MNNEDLYGWVFHFNPYTQLWNTVRREDYFLLFSGVDKSSDKVLKSSQVNTLVELINKTKGEPERIEAFLKKEKRKLKT